MTRTAHQIRLAVVGCLTFFTAAAQKPLTVQPPTLLGFKAPISEGGRMMAMVSGREARPSTVQGQVEITDFRLEIYRDPPVSPDREIDLTVESPQGRFGPKGATSDKAIALKSADGRFSITGEGWSWEQATGLLVISNRVLTSLKRAATPIERPPVEVSASQFEYNLKSGDAHFHGDCVALEPGHARILAGDLLSRFTVRAVHPEVITATNGVAMELLRPDRTGQTTGSHARYTTTSKGDQIELEGDTTWQFGAVSGSADHLVFLPQWFEYKARGHARMQVRTPARSSAGDDLPPVDEPEPLEIECESIDARPHELLFEGAVLATQTNRLNLRAGRVAIALTPGPVPFLDQVTQITATNQVVATMFMRTNAVELRGQQMVYTLGEPPVIEVTGGPSWRTQSYTGSGDRFVIHPDVPNFEALGHVGVSWEPAGGTTNVVPIQLSAERMVLEGLVAKFTGDVSARQDAWELHAGEVDLQLTTNAVLQEIVARRDVALEYLAPARRPSTNSVAPVLFAGLVQSASDEARRWKVTTAELRVTPGPHRNDVGSIDARGDVHIENLALAASGGRLTYPSDDGRLRLLENPRLLTLEGLEIAGAPESALAFDPDSGRFFVEGAVRKMTMPAHALRSPRPKAAPGQP